MEPYTRGTDNGESEMQPEQQPFIPNLSKPMRNDRDNLLRPVHSQDERPKSSTLSGSQGQRLIDKPAAPCSPKRPLEPRQLRYNKWQLMFDLLSAISALPFVALALVAMIFNSRSVDEHDWDDLQIAMKTVCALYRESECYRHTISPLIIVGHNLSFNIFRRNRPCHTADC